MKSILIVALLFFSIRVACGQSKSVSIPKDQNGNMTFWYDYLRKWEHEVGLKSLIKSDHEFHFRFWDDGQIIDIWKESDLIKGQLTNYTRKFSKDVRSKKKLKVYSSKTKLEHLEAGRVYDLILKSKINDIPSENSISGWAQGTDGITYITEYVDKNSYFFKSYWTPSVQKGIKEALLVEAFVKQVETELTLKEQYNSFFATLPIGCYNTGNIIVRCRDYTKGRSK